MPTLLEELSEGSGPLPRLGDKVVCHYSGFIASSNKKFDCSRDRGHAMTFPVGVGKVIDGWDAAIREMAKGSRRRVLIPAAEAYGARGQPPQIPPNADLIFDIELLDINETLVSEGMRIRREEAARADKFIREQDALRAAEAARHQQQPAPSRISESGSSSRSSSDESDSSSVDSEVEQRREKKRKRNKEERKARKHAKHSTSKEKKEKKEAKEKKEKKEKRSGRDKKGKQRIEKKEKKEKKHKRERHAPPGPVVAHAAPKWGTFGIIRESDLHEKQEEFLAWLSEVKGVPQASCGRRELQEHFAGFVEDYNTATMPSEKYYDMRKWYYQEQARLQREGSHAGDNEVVRTTFDDEAERKAELQSERAKREHALTALIAKSMHDSSSLVADMREQEAKRLKAQDAYRLGDASTARDLVQKLDPKYVSAEELRATFGGPAKATKSRPPQKQ